jgi:hypothetical protein
MYIIAYTFLGHQLPILYQQILASIAFVWIFFAYGLVASWLPAITDGHTVSEGLKISIQLARQSWKRIYGVLAAYLAIAFIGFGPAALYGWLFTPAGFIAPLDPLATGIMIYSAFAALFLVFLGIPAHLISMTRNYMELTGKKIQGITPEEDVDISLVGG